MKISLIPGLSLLVLTLLCGCSQQSLSDPLKKAVGQKVMETNPSLEWYSVLDISCQAEVTLSQELDRRVSLFEKKIRAEKQLARECRKKGDRSGEREHLATADRTAKIISALGGYRKKCVQDADSIIYRVYFFKGCGETKDGDRISSEKEMICTVSPDLRVYNIVPAKDGNVYEGMGNAIPGYRELITQFRSK